MPKGSHRNRRDELLTGLSSYEELHGSLPGIADPVARATLVEQFISSLRRIEFVRGFRHRPMVSPERINPHSPLFDPLKGAFFLDSQGARDEAVWLTFVATHFGKHVSDGWKLAGNVFGSFGNGPIWTLNHYNEHVDDFEAMLVDHQADLEAKSVSGRFSNHRQYQSKKAERISLVFSTFHEWLLDAGGMNSRVRAIHLQVGQEPTAVFRELFGSLETVYGFGRLGTFDFLTMLDKLDLAPIRADSVHFAGATGPLAGAKLLLLGSTDANGKTKALEEAIDSLDDHLQVGKQVLEDSLCNWQKSPTQYVYFRG